MNFFDPLRSCSTIIGIEVFLLKYLDLINFLRVTFKRRLRIIRAISAGSGTGLLFQSFAGIERISTTIPKISLKNCRTFLTCRNQMEEIGYSPISIHESVTTGFIPPQKAPELRLKLTTRHKRRWRSKFSPGSEPPVSHGLMYLLRLGAYRLFVPQAKLWECRKM